MFQQNAIFPHCRTYVTRWSAEDCRMFLGRKNIYDVYAYSFEERDGKYCIFFKEQLRFRTVNKRPRNDPTSVYSISFEEADGETRFTVSFEYTEGLFGDVPGVDYESMDKFFEVKLDARRAWPGK